MDRFDDAQEEEPKKGIIARLAERFFPPTVLGEHIKKKLPKQRTPPPARRRPTTPPIDMMGQDRKKKGT